jgi:hypothetical protein
MPTGGGKQIGMRKLIKELLQFFPTNLQKSIWTLTTPNSAIDYATEKLEFTCTLVRDAKGKDLTLNCPILQCNIYMSIKWSQFVKRVELT